MDKLQLKALIDKGAGPGAIFAALAGFFSDVVKPLINLVPYFFAISLALTLFLWFKKIKPMTKDRPLEEVIHTKIGTFFALCFLSTAIWLIFIPIFAVTPDTGLAAQVVPGISDFQNQMLARFDRLENKIDTGFDKVLSKIDSIDKSAGLVSSPSSANDYYHNAQVYQLSNNPIEARKAYEKYFESNLAYFDPFLDYETLLKSLEGNNSTKEIMAALRAKYPDNPSAELAYILLNDNQADRAQLLKTLTEKNPQFAPAFFYFAKQYSYAEAGMQTNNDRKLMQENFQKVQEMENSNQDFTFTLVCSTI